MSQNEVVQRKAILSAVGVTSTPRDERDFNAKLAQGLSQMNPKTKSQVVALTTISTANATDLPTAQTLANDCKTKINQIIAALKA